MDKPAPMLQADIQRYPVKQWPEKLAEIADEATRERVRAHLKTVYLLRNREK